MPLHIGRWTWPAVALLALVAVGLAWSTFSFDTEPAAAPTQAERPGRPDGMPARRGRRGERTGDIPLRIGRRRPVNAPPGSPGGAVTEMRLPEDLSAVVALPQHLQPQTPEVRQLQMETRLDEVAAARGWPAEKTIEVKALLNETLDGVESRVTGITDRTEWAEARRDVVKYRQAQAKRIAEVLGEDDFREFVVEMRFSRVPSSTGQPGIRWMPSRLRDDE